MNCISPPGKMSCTRGKAGPAPTIMPRKTRRLFAADTNLMAYFNHTFAGGKWDHFMDQPHLGYTGWNEPPHNSLRAIKLTEVEVPDAAAMGVAVEGSESAWPRRPMKPSLPTFDAFNQQRHFIDVFNKGKTPFEFTATASEPWIILSETTGTIGKDQRLWVSVDWSKAPKGAASGTVKLVGAANEVIVNVNAFNPTEPTRDSLHGFVEGEGFVSIEPEHFTRKIDAGANHWIKIQDYGRTLVRHAGDAARGCAERDAGKRFAMPGIPDVSVQHRRGESGHDHLAHFEFRPRARTASGRFI